jgi:hypothetical protein
MVNGAEIKRIDRFDGDLDTSGLRNTSEWESVTEAGCHGLLENRYERFEPITVRAAARVLHLQRTGIVTPAEARFYLQELTAMDAHAAPGSSPSLARLAERRLPNGPAARPGRARGYAGPVLSGVS